MLLSRGVDIEELVEEYDATRTLNLLDQLYAEEALQDSQTEKAVHKIRVALNQIYNRDKATLEERYASSNDEVGENGEETPFTSRAPRPMLTPTQQDESGYIGLEPPMG